MELKYTKEELKYLHERFDRHLEIYAQNNKELQAVKANQMWLMRFFWAFMTPTIAGIFYIVVNT